MNGGKLIKTMRKARGFTQLKLAELTGFSESSIQNWESGGTEPRFNAVNVVAITLNFTLNEAMELARNAA